MRSIAALIAVLAATAGPGPAAAQGKLPCESQPPGYDTHVVKCSLSATGAAQRLRFKADFSGSHDDTTASITTTLDGVPLACDKGSKTSTQGEDGEVSLECRFSLAGEPGTKRLEVRVQWRHAQYKDFELRSD
ncbi:MAG TPA: hypothetical protein VE008_12430 [Burkholderiales bacterium]|nr:hypothetical protein [Burkholderiales bacterium]